MYSRYVPLESGGYRREPLPVSAPQEVKPVNKAAEASAQPCRTFFGQSCEDLLILAVLMLLAQNERGSEQAFLFATVIAFVFLR